ncbi:MAG: Uma2 family endonuclease [Anaerolineales bacterium]
MTDTTQTDLLTAEDLLALPIGQGERYELIEGELHTMSPTGLPHGFLAMEFGSEIRNYVRKHRLGIVTSAETGFIIRPDTVRVPDVAFIPKARLPEGDVPSGFGTVAPALVVEVISPNESAPYVQRKTQTWLDFGVDEVWNVYSEEKTVAVFVATEDGAHYRTYGPGDTLTSAALPGLSLALDDLFNAAR